MTTAPPRSNIQVEDITDLITAHCINERNKLLTRTINRQAKIIAIGWIGLPASILINGWTNDVTTAGSIILGSAFVLLFGASMIFETRRRHLKLPSHTGHSAISAKTKDIIIKEIKALSISDLDEDERRQVDNLLAVLMSQDSLNCTLDAESIKTAIWITAAH